MNRLRENLPDLLLVLLGLPVMALLLYLGAMAHGWVAITCFLAVAVVYHTWYRVLLRLARRVAGGPDDDDDQPFFPG